MKPITETPDGHPRADELTAFEAQFQSRWRSAVALLSSGSSGIAVHGGTDRVAGVQVESPEARVLRVAYTLDANQRAAGAVAVVRLELSEGMDAGGYTRDYLVPAQGLAVAIPAGFTRAELRETSFGQVQATQRVAMTLSAGVLSRRWYSDPNFVGMVVNVFPLTDTAIAPHFACRCRALVTAGSLADPTSGVTLATAGQSLDLPIAPTGLVTMSAGLPNTTVVLAWEIAE